MSLLRRIVGWVVVLLVQAPVAVTAQTREAYVGVLDTVAAFADMMPTGVAVSREGRIFVNFPRWGDEVPFTVAEIRDGMAQPYPNPVINRVDTTALERRFVSVQSVVVDPADRLWVLDTGRPEFRLALPGGPKLVGIDLATDSVVNVIVFPDTVVLSTSYLNDIRFDLRRGEAGIAYITDSSPERTNAFIVVDLGTGRSWRRLAGHPAVQATPDFLPIVEGRPLMNRAPNGRPTHMTVGADGLALHAGGGRLFFRPLSGRELFSVSADGLADRNRSEEDVAATVRNHGDLGFASDGLEADDTGRIYLTNYEDNAILRRHPDGNLETLVHDPRVLWPDTLCLASDGFLYFTVNQLHRQPGFHGGADGREPPYVLFRVAVDARPVQLR